MSPIDDSITTQVILKPYQVEVTQIVPPKDVDEKPFWEIQLAYGTKIEFMYEGTREKWLKIYSPPNFKIGDDIKDRVVICETRSKEPFWPEQKSFNPLKVKGPYRYRRADLWFVDQILDLSSNEPGEPAFITRYNWKRLIRRAEAGESPLGNIEREFPQITSLFQEAEIHHLRLMKRWADNPKLFATSVRFRPTDSKRYVIPESAPAYHESKACPQLSADYSNWMLPRTVMETGKIDAYRRWFKSNDLLRRSNPSKFVESAAQQFNLPKLEQEQVLEEVNFSNSGHEVAAVEMLHEKITHLFGEAESIRILGDEDKLADCKRVLIGVLEEYYQAKISSNLSFGRFWLQMLGFRPCSTCVISQ